MAEARAARQVRAYKVRSEAPWSCPLLRAPGRGAAVPDLGGQRAGKQLSEPPPSMSWKPLMLGHEEPQNRMVRGDGMSS